MDRNEFYRIYRKALRTGKLVRGLACTNCLSETNPIHGHHTSYESPMDVVWLCNICHATFHSDPNLSFSSRRSAFKNKTNVNKTEKEVEELYKKLGVNIFDVDGNLKREWVTEKYYTNWVYFQKIFNKIKAIN